MDNDLLFYISAPFAARSVRRGRQYRNVGNECRDKNSAIKLLDTRAILYLTGFPLIPRRPGHVEETMRSI